MNQPQHLILSENDFFRSEAGYRLTEKGFSKVARQKRAALKRYAEGMVGADWSDDIVQNVFIKMLSQDFRDNNGGVVMVWMYRVAHNESFDLVRRQEKIRTPEFLPDTPAQPEAERWELRQRIDSILDRLAPMEKACFSMIHQGYSYKEVGESLAISEDNVAVIIHRARKKITAMAI
jgi:RNA polymerase sigma factor (sigma-70 family)